MHAVAEFLGRLPPFDTISSDDLDHVAAAVEIEFFATGALVVAQGGAPPDAVRVVRRGSVEVVSDGRPIDQLGEGELFGHAAMLSGLPTTLGFRAAEDTLTYRIPAAVMQRVLARPEGLRYLARSLDAFDPARTPVGVDPASRRVGDLLRTGAIVLDPGDSIREAARRMTDEGQSSAVIRLAAGALGIVTDRDLRRRVVAEGRNVDDPVADVMSSPAYTVTADRLGSEVLLEMLDRGLRHFPVLGPSGALLGVIGDSDLMAVETRTPFHLRAAIARAATIADAQVAARRLPATVVALWDARVAPATISATISVVCDALTRRLLELVTTSVGAPPAPFSWLALGSHARREGVPSSDVDSALLWHGADDDPVIRSYVRDVAAQVVEAHAGAGFPACDKGAVASMPLFSRSLDAWRETAESWIDEPDQEKALILVSVVCDNRPVWGLREGAALQEAFRDARNHPILMRGLAQLALAHRPPTGFLRDIVVEHSGEHHGTLDLKGGGLLPIVDLARHAGMAAGVVGASTRDRLRAAAAAGTLATTDARTLEEAFELISTLRLEHQVRQLREGIAPNDHIDPARLNRLTRTYLKDAFRAVARIQRAVAADLTMRPR